MLDAQPQMPLSPIGEQEKNATSIINAVRAPNMPHIPEEVIKANIIARNNRGIPVIHALILADKTEYFPYFSESILYCSGQADIKDLYPRSTKPCWCSTLHLLALKGYLPYIGENNLKGRTLQHTDTDMRNVFHYAAMGGHLDQLPKKVLTVRNLTSKTHKHTPLEYAAANKHLDQVPILVLETINQSSTAREYMKVAARFGNLGQVPEKLLLANKKALMGSDSPIDEALNLNKLRELPAVICTSEIFSKQDYRGDTIVNKAVQHGYGLPSIDLEVYTIPNHSGKTPLYFLQEQDRMNDIMEQAWPKSFKPLVSEELWEANKQLHTVSIQDTETNELDMF